MYFYLPEPEGPFPRPKGPAPRIELPTPELPPLTAPLKIDGFLLPKLLLAYLEPL